MNQEVCQEENKMVKKKKMNGCLLATIIFVVVAALAVGGCFILGGAALVGSAKKQEEQDAAKRQALENTAPSDLQPSGELADIFNLMSDYTDLQRENKEAEIIGKIVEWTLPLYEIQKSGENYRIRTNSGNNIGTIVTLSPRNNDERVFFAQLKTGDPIRFKGFIDGISITRSLEIEPAILINSNISFSGEKPKTVPSNETGRINSPPQQETLSADRVKIFEEPQLTLIGKPSKCGGIEAKINAIDYIETLEGSFGSSTASNGAVFVVVNWNFKNISTKPIGAFNKPTLYLVSKDKTRYSIDVGASATYATSLDVNEKIISDLNPGISSDSSAVFEVAKELYDPFYWNVLVEFNNEEAWFSIREMEALPSSSDSMKDIGEGAIYGETIVKVDSVLKKESYGNLLTAYVQPIEESIFVEINWTIENRSRNSTESKGFEMFLVPEDGKKFVPHRAATAIGFIDDGVLYQLSQSINPNTNLSRREVFEVPKSSFRPAEWGIIVRNAGMDNWFSLVDDKVTKKLSDDETNHLPSAQITKRDADNKQNTSMDEARALLEMEKIKLEREKIEFEREKLRMGSGNEKRANSDAPEVSEVESFVTSITRNDTQNSKGVRITDPVLILMQDRANVHRFGNPDGDVVDQFFKIAGNRAKIRTYLGRGSFPKNVQTSILTGNGDSFRISVFKNENGKDCVDVSIQNNEKYLKHVTETAKDSEALTAVSVDLYELIDSESNIREGPGTNYPIMRESRKGEVGEHQSSKLGWMKLQFSDGSMGWVHEKSLKSQN